MASQWRASWISLSSDPREDIGVFSFRCRLSLDQVPDSFLVRVSADQRYKLFCDGSLVDFGPQRGDEKHWFYETLDLAPFLCVGENLFEALVWNFGRWAPMAQCSARTGFVLEAPIGFEQLSTPGDWEVARVSGWDFAMMHSGIGEFYIDVGPGEIIDASLVLSPTCVYHQPNIVCVAEDRGALGGGTPWMLIPRSLPRMRYEKRAARPVVRRGFLGDRTPSSIVDGQELPDALELAPGENLLLDFGELLCAYPRITLASPALEGAEFRDKLTLTYAEALWNEDDTKGNRNDVAGKAMHGYQDVFVPFNESATLETLWWRTFRYVLIECSENPENRKSTKQKSPQSGIQSLKFKISLDVVETGYPLVAESSFSADDASIEPIWDIALRTAERCAGETYFDCPYYEQLQYIGDTRIQALIGYYIGRDRALQRNAVETLGWSLMENGLTQSRYPSRQVQVIPPFSLWWVMMVRDQFLYDQTPDETHIANSDLILQVALRERDKPAYWQFFDWVPEWRWGIPQDAALLQKHLRVLASVMSPSTLLMCQELADDEIASIESAANEFFEEFTISVDKFVEKANLPPPRRLEDLEFLAIRKGGEVPTEHGETLYRLAQLNLGFDATPWPAEALQNANAAKCTYYFQYYKHLAMFGAPEQQAPQHGFLSELHPWREMIESGLSTFAETPEPTRSDCHAWSAHPILGFFQIIAGVTSIEPAWKKAQIMPHPGNLRRFDARIAHPDGELRVAYENEKFTIDSPVPFEFRWRELSQEFEPGNHAIG